MNIKEQIRTEIERRLSWRITLEARAAYNNILRFLDTLPEQPVNSLPEWKWVKPDKQYPVGITREMDVNGDWQYCMSSGRLYESCQYLSLAELERNSIDAGPYPIENTPQEPNAADKKAVKEIVKTTHKEVTRQVKEMVGKQPVEYPTSTEMIAEWENNELPMLREKDFRGDAERMAYNAFMDGFAKGLGYRK